ncbi:pyocin knob domain-containing protein [Achromobacter spanius]|uniref:pyocin knob domain-containing protein n=1 Tax=Achromobacter spanius TaxID=217203 RepID=UPI0037FBC7A0
MPDYSAFQIDLDTPQTGGGRGESPRSAFTKINELMAALGIDIGDAISADELGVAGGVPTLDDSTRLEQQHAFSEIVYAGTDANSLVLPGFYVIQSDANATAALNWPILLAGTLLVEATNAGNMQVTQTYTTRNGSGGAVRTFKRVRFGAEPGVWGTWQESARIADLSTLNSQVATLNSQMAQAFGVGQTWQNVGASRAPDINYTNSTGRPILMSVTVLLSGPSGRVICYVDNRVSQDAFNPSAGATLGGMVVVPAGSVGRIVPVQASISSWWEYR